MLKYRLTSRWVPRGWRARRPARTGLVLGAILAALAVLAGQASPVLAAPASAPSPATASPAGPDVGVRAGELVDLSTGTQLWAKAVGVLRPMGSITKVMTALLVLKAGDLNREITVTEAAIRYVSKREASSAGLIAGDVLTARELLEAMLLPSGCDAAYLLAGAYGPGQTEFIRKMNAMAKTMGLTSTHFTSFDGMPYPTEYSTYSTPADLIQLGEAAMRNPLFRSIVSQKTYYLAATPLHHAYTWHQTNGLIGSYRGALGIKTGSTDGAGNCLLFEARRGQVTLIGVVLHASPTSNPASAVAVAAKVLNWGFQQVQAPSPAALARSAGLRFLL